VYSLTYRIRSFQTRLRAVHAAFVTQFVLRRDNWRCHIANTGCPCDAMCLPMKTKQIIPHSVWPL